MKIKPGIQKRNAENQERQLSLQKEWENPLAIWVGPYNISTLKLLLEPDHKFFPKEAATTNCGPENKKS